MDGEAENVRHEFRRGAAACLPVCVSVAVYGIAFGVLAARAGLDVRTAAFMSASVHAGASQFAALQFWQAPLAAGTIVFAVFVINLRLILITGSPAAAFRNVARGKALPAMFFAAGENWALTMAEAGRGRAGPAFFAGTGLILYLVWVCSTVAGAALGSAIPIDPASCGIGFVFTAVLIAPIVSMWRGKRDIPPWLAAAAAVLTYLIWPDGAWHAVAAGVAGAAAGGFAGARENAWVLRRHYRHPGNDRRNIWPEGRRVSDRRAASPQGAGGRRHECASGPDPDRDRRAPGADDRHRGDGRRPCRDRRGAEREYRLGHAGGGPAAFGSRG